jgi:protein-disulfide isomerase
MGAILGLVGAVAYWNFNIKKNPDVLSEPLLIHNSASSIIGPSKDFFGNQNAPFTVVEFGDYECAPCHSVNPEIENQVRRHPDKLRLAFRNFPLTEIHPFALDAAKAAESARLQGRFWDFHDALYSLNHLDKAGILECANKTQLDMAKFNQAISDKAGRAVKLDRAEASRLGINGTPSFFLCCPDGRVFQLLGLSQIDDFIN